MNFNWVKQIYCKHKNKEFISINQYFIPEIALLSLDNSDIYISLPTVPGHYVLITQCRYLCNYCRSSDIIENTRNIFIQ